MSNAGKFKCEVCQLYKSIEEERLCSKCNEKVCKECSKTTKIKTVLCYPCLREISKKK